MKPYYYIIILIWCNTIISMIIHSCKAFRGCREGHPTPLPKKVVRMWIYNLLVTFSQASFCTQKNHGCGIVRGNWQPNSSATRIFARKPCSETWRIYSVPEETSTDVTMLFKATIYNAISSTFRSDNLLKWKASQAEKADLLDRIYAQLSCLQSKSATSLTQNYLNT